MMTAAVTTAKFVMSVIVVTLSAGNACANANMIGVNTVWSLNFGRFGVIEHAYPHHCFV